MKNYVGLEIELEGIYDYPIYAERYWEVVGDNSLRDSGVEFRFKEPLADKDIVKAVIGLESAIRNSEITPQLSYRTSIHVHIDVRELGTEERLKFALLYLIFEKALFRLHGNRKNNYYCVPYYLSDGEMTLISHYVSYLNGKIDRYGLDSRLHHCCKYAAMNLKTSTTIGTFEFRHMEGTYDSNKILRWINILLCMKNYAVNPNVHWKSLSGLMSSYSPRGFLEEVFGEFSQELIYPSIDNDMYEGVRSVDFIIHSV